MGSQIIGFTQANIWEIEAGTKAGRVTLRPEDYGSLGIYSAGGANGTTAMAAGIAANSPIYSFRWTQAVNLALIKRITLSVGNGVTAFTAGAAQFNLYALRSFSVSDTGGSSILPTGNQNKLRTSSMGTTLATDIRISNTATLTAGTRTKDTNPLSSTVCGIPATAGSPILAPYPILDARPGEHPLVLAQNEGFCIECVMPATGVWFFGVKTEWAELTAY